jgi:ZIP family zinc transporter
VNVIGLVLTLVLGFFIIIGAFLMHIFENKERFLVISLSMAFGVMASLIFLELLPESFEIFNEKYSSIISIAMILIFSIIGFLILKILDKFIPDHEDDDEANLIHVGIVSSIAIILHNIIEGMAIYNTFNTSINLGILLSIGVGLHNIPLGMVLSSTFYKSLSNKKKSNVIIFLISTSTFVGGLIMCIFNNVFKNEFIIGLLLSITVGMLVYINIIEILPKLIKSKDKKMIITSIIVGILILFVSVFLE